MPDESPKVDGRSGADTWVPQGCASNPVNPRRTGGEDIEPLVYIIRHRDEVPGHPYASNVAGAR